MLRILTLLIICTLSFNCLSQIPTEAYREEIKALKTDDEIADYWKIINELDQEVLLKTEDRFRYDSISVDNMIRTSLLFKIHGNKGYVLISKTSSAILPIVNLAHNRDAKINLAYWSLIANEEIIKRFKTSLFPSYTLESLSLSAYDYSLVNQESRYAYLLEKLAEMPAEDDLVKRLEKLFSEYKITKDLEVLDVIGEWQNQAFKNQKTGGNFQLVKLADQNFYFLRFDSRILLEKIEKDAVDIFKVSGYPFGWYYTYNEEGELILYDQNDEILIEYSAI
ncbi:hypothetical protein ZPR_1247 [Zunongwangia profunda SM-A87]|jgi:hypothetical protein|uniref:Uncharacterized protein n=1 Tax=Zunongwangia profunda (strain DSM 18752 / CCTCC AB 206139 / SM-A87) TaxID=655815 RepID=D5BJC0_ZUNPS|nr:hypothetical protein [Zunongwangia profunda]ADF51586.1 hypothetical protein ZPR_1247 [Zunongwangia profunda SM-A87]